MNVNRKGLFICIIKPFFYYFSLFLVPDFSSVFFSFVNLNVNFHHNPIINQIVYTMGIAQSTTITIMTTINAHAHTHTHTFEKNKRRT